VPRIELLAAVAAVTVLNACAARAPSPPALPAAPTLASAIDAIVDAPPLHRAGWGILVQDAASGAVLYERNPQRLHIPASNQKIVLATAALGRFGPDYRYRTELLAGARSGAAAGRLVVVGSGDPTWSARFHGTVTAPFDSMAGIVARAGVASIAELVIDVSRFRDEPLHPTWEVSDLPGVFAPPVDAFAAAEGTFRLALAGGPAPGTPGSAQVVAPLHQPVRVETITDTAGARPVVSTDFRARRDTIYITARVGAGAADTVTLAVTQPARSAAAALADALRRRGISVGSVVVVRDSAAAAAARSGTEPIGAMASPRMADIVTAIMRPSQNWISEQVLKTLGAEYAGEGSWRAGMDVARTYLYDVAGVDSGAVLLRDASGMSAQNLLSPAATIAMLAHARTQPWAREYRASFAQPGLAGSTLSGRLRELDGRIHAKTGTITNVNSLSGYFTAADGREILFSILSNGSGLPAATMRAAIDEVVLAMARHLDAR
jgi:serine-type D-Ala-D-Ala carboxypeptidase/endopeptidase (penicillin-binding protein 4)